MMILESRDKMKKLNKIFFVWILIVTVLTANIKVFAQDSISQIIQAEGYDVSIADMPKASIVASVSNGEILWQENPDLEIDPASLTKLMTIFIVYDAVKSGKISLTDKIQATASDQAISGISILSNTPIITGVDYPVIELVKMSLIHSSNVATTMLANFLNNDADGFIDSMNAKAKELGMTNTTFTGPSGALSRDYAGYYSPKKYSLTAPNQTTARDLAKLSIALLKAHPEITEITKQNTVTVMEGTPYAQTLKNTNHSVEGDIFGVPGVTGLKTGSSDTAGYNYIVSYQKDGIELVEVVLAVGSWPSAQGEFNRHKFGNAILKYVLKTFEQKTVYNAGVQTIQGKKIKINEPINIFVEKGKEPQTSLSGDNLTISTPFGTLYETNYMVKFEEADSGEKESTIVANEGASETTKNFIDKTLESIKNVPVVLWMILGAAIVILIMMHILLSKLRSKKRKKL